MIEDNVSVKAVTFLAFLNFSLWLFDSFELQKSKASMVESHFYGAFVWVWMQRITLPLCIFFRQDLFPNLSLSLCLSVGAQLQLCIFFGQIIPPSTGFTPL